MSLGIQSNYRTQIETRETLQREVKQQSYLDEVDRYGGITLGSTKPHPRMVGQEPPPELKGMRERAPYIAYGETIDTGRRFEPDPGSPLGKILDTVKGQQESDPVLFDHCRESLDEIRDGYTLMKSPPEYDYSTYSDELRSQAQKLREKAQSYFGNGEGMGIPVGDGKDGVKLGSQMKAMLEKAAQELDDLAQYVGDKPDPRPTMEKVGHFKSLETKAAIDVVDTYIGEKTKALENAEPGSHEHSLLMKDIDLLLGTKHELEERRMTFMGLNETRPEWKETKPLDSDRLDHIAGKKPGMFAGLLKKLGLGAWAQAFREMRNFIRGGDGGRMPPLTSTKMGETDMLSMFLEQRLRKAGCTEPSGKAFSANGLKHQIKHEHSQVLGKQQPWGKIDKTFTQSIDGQTYKFQSTLTPHNQIRNNLGTLKEGEGVCCHDQTSSHAVNVWHSELKDEDGKVMFSQIRTGVNCGYEIKDPDERKEVNDSRAMQLLELHVGSNPKLHSQALEQLQKVRDGEDAEPIVVRNLWISHLTPDNIRPLPFFSQSGNEQLMTREQNEAIQRLARNGEPFDVNVRDENGEIRTVKVKYEPIMFSIGVNEGAVARESDLLSGWSHANREYNAPSLQVLLGEQGEQGGEIGGWVRDALDANNEVIEEMTRQRLLVYQDEGDYEGLSYGERQNLDRGFEAEILRAKVSNERIEGLSRQVQDLWTSGDFMKQGQDPYKMSSRLGLLGYEIGCAMTSNCKSNKDRNSYGDVHMKDLSIQMNTKGELRAPNQPRSREEQLNLRTIAQECGNRELQHLNVGGAGYKLKGVSMVYEEQGYQPNEVGYLHLGSFTSA